MFRPHQVVSRDLICIRLSMCYGNLDSYCRERLGHGLLGTKRYLQVTFAASVNTFSIVG